jgi:hypothetical protein
VRHFSTIIVRNKQLNINRSNANAIYNWHMEAKMKTGKNADKIIRKSLVADLLRDSKSWNERAKRRRHGAINENIKMSHLFHLAVNISFHLIDHFWSRCTRLSSQRLVNQCDKMLLKSDFSSFNVNVYDYLSVTARACDKLKSWIIAPTRAYDMVALQLHIRCQDMKRGR